MVGARLFPWVCDILCLLSHIFFVILDWIGLGGGFVLHCDVRLAGFMTIDDVTFISGYGLEA